MRHPFKSQRLPKISISRGDYERLTRLGAAMLERIPDVAEELLSELERAKVVPDKRMLSEWAPRWSFDQMMASNGT